MADEKKQLEKFNASHFKFETTPQRLKKEILDEYKLLEEKKKKTDHDKMFIQMVRSKMKAVKVKLTCSHLPTSFKKTWILETAEYDRPTYIKSLIEAIRLDRSESRKAVKSAAKNFDGSPYSTVGGVFTKPGMINEIGKKTTVNDPMKAKKPRSKKANYIGVELEFNENMPDEDQHTIAAALTAAGVNRYVCVGRDGSCGWEVRVLLDDSNFVEPLTKVLKVLKDKGFTTDHRCGTHVHLDMRNRDVNECYKTLFQSQALLRKFLNKARKKNAFCVKNRYPTFEESRNGQDRYQSINTHSYSKFQTIEVRMHQGTLEADKLIPWIKLLLKMVNFKGALEKNVNTLKQATSKYNIEPELFTELQKRIISRGA